MVVISSYNSDGRAVVQYDDGACEALEPDKEQWLIEDKPSRTLIRPAFFECERPNNVSYSPAVHLSSTQYRKAELD